ncbi:MAG TPA: hypothetical protein VNZ22_10860, partial [Bacillota bacterium]|nr:hypothetical protein [Bacillota bacterium]
MMKIPWQPVPALETAAFRQVRREAIFQCFKWDVQVGDVCALSPVPIVLRPDAWSGICGMAERLAAETLAAEKELRGRPHLHERLGLPAPVLTELRRAASVEASATDLRVIRFDFHYTRQGWQISEANTDVPGGFNEASGLTRLVSQHYPGLSITGNPAQSLAQAIRGCMLKNGAAALVHATAYTDDRQVMTYLARELQGQGVEAQLVSP